MYILVDKRDMACVKTCTHVDKTYVTLFSSGSAQTIQSFRWVVLTAF